MRKIVVINQKGGAGKTTSAAMLAVGLSRKGKKVLLVDLDPQGNVAVWFDIPYEKNLYHLLVENAGFDECSYPLNNNLLVTPSDKTLAQSEIVMAGMGEGREKVLSKALAPVSNADFVILDCAPSLNLINLNAMLYSTEAVVPVSMDYLSLVGAREVIDNLTWVRDKMGHEVKVSMVIPTFYDKRDRKSQEVLETLSRHFGDKVTTPVRKNVTLAESVGAHQDIFTYAPKSYGAEDYMKIVDRALNG